MEIATNGKKSGKRSDSQIKSGESGVPPFVGIRSPLSMSGPEMNLIDDQRKTISSCDDEEFL